MDFEFLGGHLAPIPSSIETRIRQELSWIWWAMWLHAEVAELQYFAIANASGYKKIFTKHVSGKLNDVETCWNDVSCFEPFKPILDNSASISKSFPPCHRQAGKCHAPWTWIWYLGGHCGVDTWVWMVLLASERWTKGLSHVIYVYNVYVYKYMYDTAYIKINTFCPTNRTKPDPTEKQTGKQQRQVHIHLAPNEALSCDVSLPGAPFAKASPHLQQKMQHVKAFFGVAAGIFQVGSKSLNDKLLVGVCNLSEVIFVGISCDSLVTLTDCTLHDTWVFHSVFFIV